MFYNILKCPINKMNHTISQRRLKFQGSHGTSERNDNLLANLLTLTQSLLFILFCWMFWIFCPFLQFKVTNYIYIYIFFMKCNEYMYMHMRICISIKVKWQRRGSGNESRFSSTIVVVVQTKVTCMQRFEDLCVTLRGLRLYALKTL